MFKIAESKNGFVGPTYWPLIFCPQKDHCNGRHNLFVSTVTQRMRVPLCQCNLGVPYVVCLHAYENSNFERVRVSHVNIYVPKSSILTRSFNVFHTCTFI